MSSNTPQHLHLNGGGPYGPDAASKAGSEASLQRVKNLPGYTTPVFKGKEEQRAKVQADVAAKVSRIAPSYRSLLDLPHQGFIPRELVANEVNWFYSQLGIDDTYFQNESPSVISDHIIALFGAKVLAFTKHDPTKLVIDLERIDDKGNGATFIHTSPPGLNSTEGPGATCESRYYVSIIPSFLLLTQSRIDALFLDNSKPTNCYRLETYRSAGSISATASQQLRCYFVTKCHFPAQPPPSSRTDGHTDIRSVSDPVFLEKASENTLEIYQRIMWQVESRYGPVMEVFEVEGSRERRLVIGYKMGGTSRFFR